MSGRQGFVLGTLLAAVAAACVAILWLRIVPRARATALQNDVNLAEIEELHRLAREPRQAHSQESDAAAMKAKNAEESARKFAERLALLDPSFGSGGTSDRARLVQELAAKKSKPASVIEALMPPPDTPAPEAGFRLGVIGDLANAAFDAGVEDLVYVIFPGSAATPSAELFGAYLPTRAVKLEYRASYAAHRALLQGILRRRDRGPFYTLDALEISRNVASGDGGLSSSAPASRESNPNYRAGAAELLVAKVTLRRILPSPR
jgi:hypothetical protein